jgi:hypothetical protein
MRDRRRTVSCDCVKVLSLMRDVTHTACCGCRLRFAEYNLGRK